MADMPTIEWDGQSGKKYTYYIFPIGQEFKAAPGNYIFAKEVRPHVFSPIYVGETGDLSERFSGHHKMPCIKRNGATHIHVHVSSDDARTRRAEEADIILKWQPPCND